MDSLASRLKILRQRSNRSATELSLAAGLSKNTVGEIENNPDRSPSVNIVRKLAAELGVNFSYLAEGVSESRRPRTLPESEAESWDLPKPAGQRPDLIEQTAKLLTTLAPETRSPLAFRIFDAHPGFAIAADDIAIVDQSAPVQNGDMVLATIIDIGSGATTTVLRRLLSPYLVSADMESEQKPLLADGARTAIMGRVVAVFRAPQLMVARSDFSRASA